MSYLYVTESGAVVGIDGGYFVVSYKNGMTHKIPKETLESAALFGNVSVTTPCIKEFLKKGITVSYFSEKGAYFGRLESTGHKNIKRLKNQIYLSDDEEFSLGISKKIVFAKINNQIVLLRRYARNNVFDVQDEIKMMKSVLKEVNSAKSVEAVMGYEGTAARNYFKGISKIINPDFSFNGRNRMPPKDPFNSMISLGYTLLMYEIFGEIENKGLTPYCGFLHKDHERHPTLASDLMEEWRAVIVDSVVLSLIQGNEISKECFVKDDESGGVFIKKEGMSIFLKKYENKLRSENSYINGQRMSFRKCLWKQVEGFCDALKNKNFQLYEPILIR